MSSEFAMLSTRATSGPAVGSEFETAFSSAPDAHRGHNSHQALGQGTAAGQTRQRTGRRRFVDPTLTEEDRAAAEEEFMRAMNEYKQRSGRMFPTWSEVLEVLQGLGYEKTSRPPVLHDVRRKTSA
jgi:hypothetical protein